MFRASSVYPIQRPQQFRVHAVQAAQFGGGFVCHRADRIIRSAVRAIIDSQSRIDGDRLKPLN
jgi:hypothetical protein